MKKRDFITALCLTLVFIALACNLPSLQEAAPAAPPPSSPLPPPSSPTPPVLPAATESPSPTPDLPTPTIEVSHSLIPSTDVKAGKLIVDVVSSDTAPQKRAPYGDAYDINRLERPFLQDMTYVADMDIASFNLGYDDKFFYVSIELVGTNPNNQVGINYGVELDIEGDGFGDVLIVAYPPYKPGWSTDNVQVRRDINRDTGGLSGEKSDAPLPGDGYDTLIFDGGRGPEDDTDLAWVRVNAGNKATVQFAFKRSLAGAKFMYGVFADGGIRDVKALDYVDRFTEEEAGSPVRNDPHYPLKALYGMDTVCREVFGFKGTNQEPQRCPRIK